MGQLPNLVQSNQPSSQPDATDPDQDRVAFDAAEPARPRFKWHLLYFLLAGFDILTVSTGLFLTHQLTSNFNDSLSLNREWAERLAGYSQLAQLATDVNMPGNDVFDTLDVESARTDQMAALAEFNLALERARRDLNQHVTAEERTPLLVQLDHVAQAMREMDRVQQEIFEHLRIGENERAGAKMATMDRKNADVAAAIREIGGRVREIQDSHFACQHNQAQFIKNLEIGVAGMIVIMVIAVTCYGHQVGQRELQNEEILRQAATAANHHADRASEALREVESLRTSLDEHSIISIADRSGKITFVNQGFCRISGYARDDLIGRDHRMINSGVHPKAFWASVWKVITSGEVWRGEICNRAKDGSLYWVDSTIVPSLDRDGNIERFVSFRIDITNQKSAEQALAETQHKLIEHQQRFERAIAGTADGLWDYLPATGAVWYSDQFKRSIGLATEDFDNFLPVFDSFANLLHPFDREATFAAIDAHLEQNVPYDVTYRLRMTSGEYRWFRARGQSIRDASGTVVHMSGAISDIHDYHTAERRLELATRAADIGLWDWEIETGEAYFNRNFYTMLGYQDGELPMHVDTWKSLAHPDDLDGAVNDIQRHLDGVTARYDNIHRLRKADGSWLWVRDIGEIIERDVDGKPTRMVGLHIDISAVKEAENALAEITRALDASNDCVFMFEADGLRFVYANDGASKQVGYSADELRHMTPVDINPHFQDATFRDMIRPLCEQPGTSMQFRTEHEHRDGGRIHVEVSLQFNVGLGETGRFLAIVRDITGQLEAERRLESARSTAEAANQAKSDFLANMSHEIRTPMTAILGYAELLDHDKEMARDPRQTAAAIQTIRNNAHNLLTIINDILDMSKIEAGQLQVERIDTSPAQIVDEVVSLLGPRAEGKGIELHVHYDSAVPETIQSDPTRLRQILINLVGNAIKFTEVGHVAIHPQYDRQAGTIRFRVVDTGIGMTPDQRDTIARFDAFAQADSSTTRNFGGTGLGLRISNQLAKMLGGGIEVQSERGAGSTFTAAVTTGDVSNVPTINPQDVRGGKGRTVSEKSPIAEPTPSPRIDGLHVLLAEDGPDNQRLISFLLKKAGAGVELAADGQVAYEMALAARDAGRPFDVILMDMQMPVMDGYSAATALRDAGYTGPIIAATAHAMSSDRDKCLAAGCDDFLTKPIDRRQLIELVATHGPGVTGGQAEAATLPVVDEAIRSRQSSPELPVRS